VLIAVQDIIKYGSVEQNRVLRNNSNPSSQLASIDLANVFAENSEIARLELVESRYQLDNAALA